jgi:hypothetical protein
MPYAPDIGLAFNALAPPTERWAAGYVPTANKVYLVSGMGKSGAY